jgi:hypothetical protein
MNKIDISGRNIRLSGRFGWGFVLGTNILLFLLPTQSVPAGLSTEAWLLTALGILLLSWLGMLTGIGLLVIRYHWFFKQIKGVLLFLGLLVVGFRLFFMIFQIRNDSGWFFSQLSFLLTVWLIILPFALVLATAYYLWFNDQSVRFLAIILLIIPWLLIFYIRNQSAEQLLLDIIQVNLPGELFALICFGQIVFVLAPLFFIGHSLRLVYREFSRAGTPHNTFKDAKIG